MAEPNESGSGNPSGSSGSGTRRSVYDRLDTLERGQHNILEALRKLDKRVQQIHRKSFNVKSAHLEVMTLHASRTAVFLAAHLPFRNNALFP